MGQKQENKSLLFIMKTDTATSLFTLYIDPMDVCGSDQVYEALPRRLPHAAHTSSTWQGNNAGDGLLFWRQMHFEATSLRGTAHSR